MRLRMPFQRLGRVAGVVGQSRCDRVQVSELDAEVASLKDQDVTLNNRIGSLRMRADFC